MPTADDTARRHAWIVMLLLAAGLAAAASLGINHQYDTARAHYAQCLPAAACAHAVLARPLSVWAFGLLAAVLVAAVIVLAAADLRARGRGRSVVLVLGGVEPVAQ